MRPADFFKNITRASTAEPVLDIATAVFEPWQLQRSTADVGHRFRFDFLDRPAQLITADKPIRHIAMKLTVCKLMKECFGWERGNR